MRIAQFSLGLPLISNVCQCLHQFLFALRVKAAIEHDIIGLKHLNFNLEIMGTNTSFNDAQWNTKEDLLLLAENAVQLSIAGLSLAADEELSLCYGSRDPSREDYPFNLRAVIYQIRNCFAHNLLIPTYQVKSAYLRSYTLDFLPGAPNVDFKILNGTLFDYQNFGGFDNFYVLFEESEKLILKCAALSPPPKQ